LVRAAKNKLNLAVPAAGALGALLAQSWEVVGISMVAYLALLASDLSSLEFWRATLKSVRVERPSLPDRSSLSDPAALAMAHRLWDARHTLAEVVRQAPAEVKLDLTAPLASVGEVERRAVALLLRVEQLGCYLSSVNLDALHSHLRRSDHGKDSSRDQVVKGEYSQAAAIRAQQIAAMKEICDTRERLLATLEHVIATLEALPTRVVQVQVLRLELLDPTSSEASDKVQLMSDDIKRVEDSLRTHLTQHDSG
jgi:hypothetical protein